jgi:hypothetical protein
MKAVPVEEKGEKVRASKNEKNSTRMGLLGEFGTKSWHQLVRNFE